MYLGGTNLGTALEDERRRVEEELGPEVGQEPGLLHTPLRLHQRLVHTVQDLCQPEPN